MSFPTTSRSRAPLAFWIACAMVAAAAIAPLLIAFGTNRITPVAFPFAIATIALGACALLYHHGKGVTTGLYLIASLAVVYGIVAMLAVPLQLALLGVCPPAPEACTTGLQKAMTDAESTGLEVALALGIVAILVGYVGLVAVYRRRPDIGPPPATPVRRIAPVGSKAPTPMAPSPEAASPTVEPAPAAVAAPVEAESPAERIELPAPVEEPELPAPVEALELAAPVEDPELPAHIESDAAVEVAPTSEPTPARKRRTRKPVATHTPPSNSPPTSTHSGE